MHASAQAAKLVRNGRTVWRVTCGGVVRDIAVRNASVKAIDEAMRIYAPALRKLAIAED